MSKMHSTKLPPSSRAEADDGPNAAMLVETCDLLAGHGLFGLAWISRDLVAQQRFGDLAAFVTLGQRVTETVLPLFGLDEPLLELIEDPAQTFEMPNVALGTIEGRSARLNLRMYWMSDRQQFLLLISTALATGDLEIGLAQQVRARMIVEAELAQKSRALAAVNAELTRANRDLAEFAYVISHDLKAPLRAMRYLTDDLDRSLDGSGKAEPKVHAQSIRAQSQRMSRMLTDLLAYSKIGRQTDALELVDTGGLIRSIVNSMPRTPGLVISIDGAWPKLETYAAPLDLILRNLIANAIAHHDRTEIEVHVMASVTEEILEIAVADDGPGIAVEWQEAVFQPFRTVSSTPNQEQSGIGLALVRKAVETTGATLTLVSDPAVRRGTVFKLGWPLLSKR